MLWFAVNLHSKNPRSQCYHVLTRSRMMLSQSDLIWGLSLNLSQSNASQLMAWLSCARLWLRTGTRRGRTVFPKDCFYRLCMLLSTYAFLFEPCADIKCGLTIAHCPVSPPRFLSCQNSRKLGHRANKQRRPRLSPGASGPPGGTPVRMAGVGGRNPARKPISIPNPV